MVLSTNGKSCKVPGCLVKHHARGLCNNHYMNWLTIGKDYNLVDALIEPASPLYFCKKCERFLNPETDYWKPPWGVGRKQKVLKCIDCYRKADRERHKKRYWKRKNDKTIS